ncbi:MAG: transposase [Bryobacteraceae bacterium]
MEVRRRKLSQVYPEGRWLFLTWHLHGSLPHGLYPPQGLPSGRSSYDKAFVWIDRFLDLAQSGPMYLQMESIARLMQDSLQWGAENGRYELGPYVIMSNHVHALLLPKTPVPKLIQSLKGFTGKEANRILGRSGGPFWQSETYDHFVRNAAEFDRIRRYIEQNPVKAGLAATASAYRWSSAWREKPLKAAADPHATTALSVHA